MGLKEWGILIPLLLMVVATALNAGTVNGASQVGFQNTVPNNGNGGTASTCTQTFSTPIFSRTPCFTALPTQGSIICVVQGAVGTQLTTINNYCNLAPGCVSFSSLQVGCMHDIQGNYITVLYNGATATLASSGNGGGTIANSSPAAAGAFSITSDWTVVVVGLVALALVASITVFTVGLNSAAVRVMFIVGGLLVIWGVLTAASGFGSSSSMWGQLDVLKDSKGNNILLGTALYGLSSLFFTLSTIMWTTGMGE